MASERAIMAALKLLGRAFAGEVDAARLEVYRAALNDLTDEQLAKATELVIRNHTGAFIPPPAVLRQAVAPAAPAVDSGKILRRIEKLGHYVPSTGWVYPSTFKVREAFGETVAYAYTAAGAERLFTDNTIGHDIAVQSFEKAMGEALKRPGAELPVIGPPDERVQQLIDGTLKRLPGSSSG